MSEEYKYVTFLRWNWYSSEMFLLPITYYVYIPNIHIYDERLLTLIVK